jgi:hypothetical protein
VPTSRIRAAIPALPEYVFMAWYLVKHMDNFTFYRWYLHLYGRTADGKTFGVMINSVWNCFDCFGDVKMTVA